MKSVKLALLALVVAFAAVNVAYADGFKAKPKKSVNIVLSKALADPKLAVEMYKQLDKSFLEEPHPLYLAKVVHNGVLYKILGSKAQWESFFNNPWRYLRTTSKFDVPGS